MSVEDFEEGAWRDRIQRHRAEKDDFFRDHDQSPIPPDDRASFSGLDYYDVDPDYRVAARFSRAETPETVELDTSRGPSAKYDRVAVFGFDLHGDHHTLDAYRVEGEETLFVPFADETNGEDTYHWGRYLDVDVEDADTDDDVVLDFNLAYSPFCAYSDNFACALPPQNNRLPVPVRAGEKV